MRSIVSPQVLGCHATKKNAEVVNFSSVVFISVKPKLVLPVVQALAGDLQQGNIIVSVAAGISTTDIEQVVRKHL